MTLNTYNEQSAQQHELNGARRAWISRLVERLIPDRSCCTAYLEVCHAILKDFRKHIIDSDEHTGYTLLLVWIHNDNSSRWIQYALSAKQGIDLVPLVVLMLDIGKTCKALVESDRARYDSVSQEGWTWLGRHLNQICTLWLGTHIAVARRSLALAGAILRYHKHPDAIQTTLTSLVTYIRALHQHMTRIQLYSLFEPERTEFFYSNSSGDNNDNDEDEQLTVDRECLKQATQIFFTAIAALADVTPNNSPNYDTLKGCLQELVDYITFFCQETEDILDILFELHGNNDEDAVNLQLDILNLYEKLTSLSSAQGNAQGLHNDIKHILDTAGISPNRLFLFFCQRTGMDHSLLVDLLLSNETEFLLFFVQYLKYVERNPEIFVYACNDFVAEDHPKEEVTDMLRGVMAVLQSGGFPYNPTYLINRLTNVLKLLE
ncbi:hypothetical protein BDB00DRAFT_868664 [Zychaea mexicana]|uniref:uncharacterized protein n=1 Tax=Zychaea mexicana TaxID=64656 RepID=UPI0022FE100C|nr:uncharacterized protein BDB00DRAFT_868664 [Zychaea mexicana]KAI9497209.1 hypothetical protein BDB00DRAFT_868664 [Zychaea mexicana]